MLKACFLALLNRHANKVDKKAKHKAAVER